MNLPDYSTYQFRELYEALDRLRADVYPDVLNALEAEIARRNDVGKPLLEEAYFRLDRARFPSHEQQLRQRIEALGGFDTIAPETITADNRFKTGWRRFWAMIFDIIIFQLLILGPIAGVVQSGREDDLAFNAAVSFCTQLAVIFYFVLMHAVCGQTLGKMITGVKVVRNADLAPIALRHALMRDIVPLLFLIASVLSLSYFDFGISEGKNPAPELPPVFIGIFLLGFAWPLLEVLTMLFNRRRRAIHDYIAGTVVTRYLRRPKAAPDRNASTPATSAA